MTNREKYAEQILDIACSGSSFAVDKDTMKLTRCQNTDCYQCYFCESNNETEDCNVRCQEWCNAEYVEPPIDWSKVPVDTPILVSYGNDVDYWQRRHFAKFQDGKVYAWANGLTSWTAKGEYMSWEVAKLAESED